MSLKQQWSLIPSGFCVSDSAHLCEADAAGSDLKCGPLVRALSSLQTEAAPCGLTFRGLKRGVCWVTRSAFHTWPPSYTVLIQLKCETNDPQRFSWKKIPLPRAVFLEVEKKKHLWSYHSNEQLEFIWNKVEGEDFIREDSLGTNFSFLLCFVLMFSSSELNLANYF